MRHLSVIALAFALSACGTVATTRIDTPVAESVAFQFNDERPAEQRVSAKSSGAWGWSTTMGDDAVTPPAPTLFKTWIARNLKDSVAGRAITLTEFKVVVTEYPPQPHQGPIPVYGGALGVLIAAPTVALLDSMTAQKMVSVSISGKVGDAAFSARNSNFYKARVTESNVNTVILKTLDELIPALQLALNKPPETTAANSAQPAANAGAEKNMTGDPPGDK